MSQFKGHTMLFQTYINVDFICYVFQLEIKQSLQVFTINLIQLVKINEFDAREQI